MYIKIKNLSRNTLIAIISIIAVITLSTAGFLYLQDRSSNSDTKSGNKDQNEQVLAESTSKEVSIKVTNKDNTETYKVGYNSSEELNAFDILQRLQEENENFEFSFQEYDFGAMITSINGVTPAENQFWKLQVNGQDSQTGVSAYIVKEEDELGFIIDNMIF